MNINEFKKTTFPIKRGEKVEKMTGDQILKSYISNTYNLKSIANLYPILIYLALNDLYSRLNELDKVIVDNFFVNLPLSNNEFDNLHYVNNLNLTGFTLMNHNCKEIMDDLIIFYEPLIPINPFNCEEIVNYMNEKYATNNYERALNFTHFAETVYKKCPKDERHLFLVAKYGLLSYQLKDDWLNLWQTKPVLRIDYFWTTLCNVLRKLNRYDEAIDIAKTGIKYDAYDISEGGWQARLERLQKAKVKNS